MLTQARAREPKPRFTTKPARKQGMLPVFIQAHIKAKGSNLTMLAKDLNCTPEAVGNVITGRISSRRIANAIAELIQLPLETLWPGRYPALSTQPADSDAVTASDDSKS